MAELKEKSLFTPVVPWTEWCCPDIPSPFNDWGSDIQSFLIYISYSQGRLFSLDSVLNAFFFLRNTEIRIRRGARLLDAMTHLSNSRAGKAEAGNWI